MTEKLARDLPHVTSHSWPLFANSCPVALCQRRQPPKAGAVGQRLQRVAGQPSLTIKSDGWFPLAAGPTDPRAALCKDDLGSGTDSAPFMRGFSPPPTGEGLRNNLARHARTTRAARCGFRVGQWHGEPVGALAAALLRHPRRRLPRLTDIDQQGIGRPRVSRAGWRAGYSSPRCPAGTGAWEISI